MNISKISWNNKISRSDYGTFTVWAIGLCLTLFMLGGISIDVWRAFDARRTLNEIADTSARAGANQIDVRQRQLYGDIVLDPVLAKSATQNSISDNASVQSVTIDSYDVDVNSSTDEVDVELHSTFSFFLLRMFPGGSSSDITAKATARPYEG